MKTAAETIQARMSSLRPCHCNPKCCECGNAEATGFWDGQMDAMQAVLSLRSAADRLSLPVSNTGENAELVKQLLDNRVRVHDLSGVGYEQCPLSRAAATALVAADARIAELKADRDSHQRVCIEQLCRAETAEALLDEAGRALSEGDKALETANTALEDWLHRYAPDECKESHVLETSKRINEAGGTLAYLADVFAVIRRARATFDRIGK